VAALRVDPIAPLRARNRRRLIGAAALLLAVVIVVPLILDPAPRPLPPSVPIVLPGEKTPFTPRLSLPQNGAAPLAPPPDVRENGAVEPAVADAARGDTVGVDAAKAAKGDGAGSEVTRPDGAKAGAAQPATTTSDAKVETGKAAAAKAAQDKRDAKAKRDEIRARDALEGKVAATEPGAPAKGRYVVQAAALANEVAANDLAERIRQAGITSYTERVQAGDLVRWRVRAGPYATRDDAQRARGRLKDLGIEATLVAP
jgi:DedD protein